MQIYLYSGDTNPKPVSKKLVLLNNYGTKGGFLSLFLLKLQVFPLILEI